MNFNECQTVSGLKSVVALMLCTEDAGIMKIHLRSYFRQASVINVPHASTKKSSAPLGTDTRQLQWASVFRCNISALPDTWGHVLSCHRAPSIDGSCCSMQKTKAQRHADADNVLSLHSGTPV